MNLNHARLPIPPLRHITFKWLQKYVEPSIIFALFSNNHPTPEIYYLTNISNTINFARGYAKESFVLLGN